MKISVLIATYNRPNYLKRCLDALAVQTVLPAEIVVVVRDEDEPTRKVVSEYAEAQKQRIQVNIAKVSEPGIVKAENAGLLQVSGDIVCFIDDDSIACEEWLERLAFHYKDPIVGGVGGPVIPCEKGIPVLENTDKWGQLSWIGAYTGNVTKIPNKTLEVDVLPGSNMSFRRNLLSKHALEPFASLKGKLREGFDENLKGYDHRFEDDMTMKVKNMGYRIICEPKAKVYHLAARSGTAPTPEQMQNRIFCNEHNNTYVRMKHFQFPRRAIFFLFTFLVGDRYQGGLFRYLYSSLKFRNLSILKHEMIPALKGKLAGIRTYYRWKKVETVLSLNT